MPLAENRSPLSAEARGIDPKQFSNSPVGMNPKVSVSYPATIAIEFYNASAFAD